MPYCPYFKYFGLAYKHIDLWIELIVEYISILKLLPQTPKK